MEKHSHQWAPDFNPNNINRIEMTNILQNIYNYSKKPATLAIEDILYYYINIYLINIEINRLEVEKLIAYAQQHSSFSQYFGQIRRCTDLKCCAPQPAEITSIFLLYVFIINKIKL